MNLLDQFKVLDPPGKAGWPPMCRVANLPALDSAADCDAWLLRTCGHSLMTWQCPFCDHWHTWPGPHGVAKNYKIPKRVVQVAEGFA